MNGQLPLLFPVPDPVGYRGPLLRDAGSKAVERNHEWPEGDAAMRELIASGEPFTAEDVRRIAGSPPVANLMGALFLRYRKQLRKRGYRQATRAPRHASLLAEWEGR